jgi:hypothetical protein
MMKREQSRIRKTSQKHHVIKIYTTPELLEQFAKRAASQNRSVSSHGEFLVRQDLAVYQEEVA